MPLLPRTLLLDLSVKFNRVGGKITLHGTTTWQRVNMWYEAHDSAQISVRKHSKKILPGDPGFHKGGG